MLYSKNIGNYSYYLFRVSFIRDSFSSPYLSTSLSPPSFSLPSHLIPLTHSPFLYFSLFYSFFSSIHPSITCPKLWLRYYESTNVWNAIEEVRHVHKSCWRGIKSNQCQERGGDEILWAFGRGRSCWKFISRDPKGSDLCSWKDHSGCPMGLGRVKVGSAPGKGNSKPKGLGKEMLGASQILRFGVQWTRERKRHEINLRRSTGPTLQGQSLEKGLGF